VRDLYESFVLFSFYQLMIGFFLNFDNGDDKSRRSGSGWSDCGNIDNDGIVKEEEEDGKRLKNKNYFITSRRRRIGQSSNENEKKRHSFEGQDENFHHNNPSTPSTKSYFRYSNTIGQRDDVILHSSSQHPPSSSHLSSTNSSSCFSFSWFGSLRRLLDGLSLSYAIAEANLVHHLSSIQDSFQLIPFLSSSSNNHSHHNNYCFCFSSPSSSSTNQSQQQNTNANQGTKIFHLPPSTFLSITEFGVFQYLIVRICLLGIVAGSLISDHLSPNISDSSSHLSHSPPSLDHGESGLNLIQDEVILGSALRVINLISQSISLYCLFLIYTPLIKPLGPLSPIPKFLAIKSIVFITWCQALSVHLFNSSFSSLSTSVNENENQLNRFLRGDQVEGDSFDPPILDGPSSTLSSSKYDLEEIQDLLLCVEMFVACVVFYFTFPIPKKEQEEEEDEDQNENEVEMIESSISNQHQEFDHSKKERDDDDQNMIERGDEMVIILDQDQEEEEYSPLLSVTAKNSYQKKKIRKKFLNQTPSYNYQLQLSQESENIGRTQKNESSLLNSISCFQAIFLIIFSHAPIRYQLWNALSWVYDHLILGVCCICCSSSSSSYCCCCGCLKKKKKNQNPSVSEKKEGLE